MTESDILKFRLSNHLITKGKLKTPEDVVSWMGAIQAQDYGQAKYSIASRTTHAKNSDIERAISDKRLVRTWALRGTLHILAAADVYWILSVVTPVILTRYKPQFKKLDLDDTDFAKTHHCLIHLLQGGKQLTRKELFDGLEQNNISTYGLKGNLLLYKAGWLGIICLGPMKGKQDTYTLLEEWLPKPPPLAREEALAKLAQRYFQSHGPATLHDFISWSGLSITEGRKSFELIRETLTQIEVNNQLYWMTGKSSASNKFDNNTYFLAGFDEYMLGYKDRSLIQDAADTKKVILPNGLFKPIIIKNGKTIGTWSRTILKNKVNIETNLFDQTYNDSEAIQNEIKKYLSFMDFHGA
jgi:hypothetical protein